LVLDDVLATGRPGLLCRERLIRRMAIGLRKTAPPDAGLADLPTGASLAAIWHIVQADLLASRAPELPTVTPLLSYVLLAPVLGPAAAAETAEAAADSRSSQLGAELGNVSRSLLTVELLAGFLSSGGPRRAAIRRKQRNRQERNPLSGPSRSSASWPWRSAHFL